MLAGTDLFIKGQRRSLFLGIDGDARILLDLAIRSEQLCRRNRHCVHIKRDRLRRFTNIQNDCLRAGKRKLLDVWFELDVVTQRHHSLWQLAWRTLEGERRFGVK